MQNHHRPALSVLATSFRNRDWLTDPGATKTDFARLLRKSARRERSSRTSTKRLASTEENLENALGFSRILLKIGVARSRIAQSITIFSLLAQDLALFAGTEGSRTFRPPRYQAVQLASRVLVMIHWAVTIHQISDIDCCVRATAIHLATCKSATIFRVTGGVFGLRIYETVRLN